MSKKYITLFFFIFSFFYIQAKDKMTLFVLENKPFGYIDDHGNIAGTHYEYLVAIMERTNIDYEIFLAPKSRVVDFLKSGEIDGAIFFRSDERNGEFIYVDSIRAIRTVAIARKTSPVRSFEDLCNHQAVGIIRGTIFPSKYMEDNKINWYQLNNYPSMIMMLKAKRIDVITGNVIILHYFINKFDLKDDIDPLGFTIEYKEQWFHLSKSSKFASKANKIKQVISELKKEKFFDSVLSRYVGPDWETLNK